jgi:hypothetical protein
LEDYSRTMVMRTRKNMRKSRSKSQTSRIRIPISRSGELGKYGYKNILKTSEKDRRAALIRFMKSKGKDVSTQIEKARKIIQKLNALAIVQKNRQPEFARRVRRDQKYVSRVLDELKDKQNK